MATDLKALTVYVSADEAQALVLLADRAQRTTSQYARLALQDHIAAATSSERTATSSRTEPTR